MEIDDLVICLSEHPKAIGKVIRLDELGNSTIEFETPASKDLPYGHIIVEFWPKSDWHLLVKIQ